MSACGTCGVATHRGGGRLSVMCTVCLLARYPAPPPATPYVPIVDPTDPIRVREYVVGYRVLRVWRSEDGHIQLGSYAYQSDWDSGWQQARCEVGRRHEAPQWGCSCGLYAFTDMGSMVHDLRHEISGGSAIVSVLATGRIVYCTHGFRAQRMRVLAIFRPNALCDSRAMIGTKVRVPLDPRDVAAEYGVPALDTEHFERYSTEFGTRHTLESLVALEETYDEDRPAAVERGWGTRARRGAGPPRPRWRRGSYGRSAPLRRRHRRSQQPAPLRARSRRYCWHELWLRG